MRDAGEHGMTATMRSSFSLWSTAAGAGAGLVLLVVYALVLLNAGGAGWKVLVAVWLAAWPVLLAGGLTGYSLAKLAKRIRSISP